MAGERTETGTDTESRACMPEMVASAVMAMGAAAAAPGS